MLVKPVADRFLISRMIAPYIVMADCRWLRLFSPLDVFAKCNAPNAFIDSVRPHDEFAKDGSENRYGFELYGVSQTNKIDETVPKKWE